MKLIICTLSVKDLGLDMDENGIGCTFQLFLANAIWMEIHLGLGLGSCEFSEKNEHHSYIGRHILLIMGLLHMQLVTF